MENIVFTLDGLSRFAGPLANAADTQGMYTAVPKTVQMLMKNIVIQYLMLYFFVTGAGADPQMALLFCLGMIVLLYMENNGLISVPEDVDA